MMTKVQMTQDQFYHLLLDRNLIISRLGVLIGQSDVAMSQAFKHYIVNGKPHSFSPDKLQRINDALPRWADSIQSCLMQFHPENNISTVPTRCYDPSCLEQLRSVGEHFNLTALTARVLGWKKSKKESVFTPTNKNYGHITQQNVIAINTELLSVAGVLRNIEVISNANETISPDKQTDKPIKTKEEEPAQKLNEWDDTSLDLWERYTRFHRLFPDGLIAFSVNDGFTVCEEDARLLARIDTTLQPYTDPATGHVTLYMDAAKWKQIRRAWDDGDELVAESPMYTPEKM